MNKGCFKKGSTPWNKGKRGYMGANPTSFKKGNTPPQQLPKGTVTEYRKHGKLDQLVVNIDWRGKRKVHNSYARYVWEVENQKDIPQGYVIYHLDGNTENNDIDNLEIITRAQLLSHNAPNHGVI